MNEPTGGTGVRALLGTYADAARLITDLGAALAAMWATPLPADGPSPGGTDALLALAARRVADGRVDPSAFDPPFLGRTADDLLAAAQTELGGPGPVPTRCIHGDARLAACRLDETGALTLPSGPRTGAGDPHRDLATLARDVAAWVSPQAVGPLVDASGLDHRVLSLLRLDGHALLDQLLDPPPTGP